nr:hypothetical protein [uncultured Macellibacteroides sp.]
MVNKDINREVGIILSVLTLVLNEYWQICWKEILFVILILSLLVPVVFSPISRLLLFVGEFMGKWVTVVLLFITFFLVVTPLAFIRRYVSKDSLLIREFKNGSESVFLKMERTADSKDLKKQY